MWGEVEVWGEIRSPALAAPSFNDCVGTNSFTLIVDGEDDDKTQAANDLCEQYRPLAFKIAGRYRDKGVPLDELRSAALLGLTVASRKFDSTHGAFGPYAKLWIKGELTRFFKPTADAMAFGRNESLDVPVAESEIQALDLQPDDREPPVLLNVSDLSEKEQTVLVGRSRGETLSELGSELGVSQERVRQIHAKATQRARKTKGNIALVGIRDLTKRRGYQKPARGGWNWSKAIDDANLGKLPPIEITDHLPRAEEQRCVQRLRSAEATDWGRKTEGAEKRFATAGSIPWKTLERGCGLSTVEIAKRKTREEHLHKFLTHHEIERLRFDLRAKLCGGNKVERPRNGIWCNKHARVSPRYEAGAVVEHERYRNDGLRLLNGVPDAYEPKPTKQADLHNAHCARLAVIRGNGPLRNPRGPHGGPVIHGWRAR